MDGPELLSSDIPRGHFQRGTEVRVMGLQRRSGLGVGDDRLCWDRIWF